MRYSFIKALTDLAQKDTRIMLLTGDLGFTVFEDFATRFPDQFINMGVAEQNMVGVAAGLALNGKIPFVYSIATFMSMRPFEQIRNDVCGQNANVKIVGTGGGLSYGHAGLTHHSLEDIGLMRLIPSMKVVCPSDPQMVGDIVHQAALSPGPFYIRLGKSGEPNIHKDLEFRIGQSLTLLEGENTAVIAVGNIVNNVLKAVETLHSQSKKVALYEMPTISPFDHTFITSLAKKYTRFVTVEEHYINGGLGTCVAEALAESESTNQLLRIGIRNGFQKVVGNQGYLRKINQLDEQGIAKQIGEFCK